MKHPFRLSKRILAWAAVLCSQLATVPQLWAQEATDAFYIYQNDGHFDGFFYDEVQCIQYSKTDTLGIEHTDYVSQEIVTADSTYRFMLTAIDSVGFVQPEIIYNPKLRNMVTEGMDAAIYEWDYSSSTIVFMNEYLTETNKPKVGDVLLMADNIEEIFCGKVTSVESDGWSYYTVNTEPVSDVKDVYKQLITVEEYSHDRNGQLVGRRVAGIPELSRGKFVKPHRASGEFEGDIFDFNLSGHIPLTNAIALDVNIEGGVNIKASWHLPLVGTSYIGITTTLSAGIGVGVSINGTLAEGMEGGLSKNATIPLPAAVPMFELVLAPDCFLRGSVTAKASVATPKMKGKLWSKLEFIDYWPYLEMGFGNPPGTTEEEAAAEEEADYYGNVSSASLEYSGFVQTGIQFPLRLRTNKWLSKVLDCEVGTTMYVGPKLSGSLSIDLENLVMGDVSFYGTYKDAKFTLSPFDADYETKATIRSFWGDPKEQTLADGTFNILPNLDLYLFPDFVDWVETDDELSITPTRNIMFPVEVGFMIFKEDKTTGKYELYDDHSFWAEMKYYQMYGAWRDGNVKLSLPTDGFIHHSRLTGEKFRVYPAFKLLGTTIQSNQSYELAYKPKTYFTNVPKEPVVFDPNGETKTICNIAGVIDESVTFTTTNLEDMGWTKIEGRDVNVTLPKLWGIVNREIYENITAYEKMEGDWNQFISESGNINIIQKPTYEASDVLLTFIGISEIPDMSAANTYHAGGGSVFKDGTYTATKEFYIAVGAFEDPTSHPCRYELHLNLIDAEKNADKRWGGGSLTVTENESLGETLFSDEQGYYYEYHKRKRTYTVEFAPATQPGVDNYPTFSGTGTVRTIETSESKYGTRVDLDETETRTLGVQITIKDN